MKLSTSEEKIDLEISELLKVIDKSKLLTSLQVLIGDSVCITNKDGEILLGVASQKNSAEILLEKLPLRIGHVILGYVEADTDKTKLESGVFLIQLLLKSLTRFEIANMLHNEMGYAPGIEISYRQEDLKLKNISASLFESFSRISTCINVLPEFVENLFAFKELISSCEGSDALTIAWEEGGLNEGLKYIDLKSNKTMPEIEKMFAYVQWHHELFKSVIDEQLCDVNSIVEQIDLTLNKIISKKIKINKELKTVPRVICFPKLLYYSLINTMLDVIEGLSFRGTITIQTGVKQIAAGNGDNNKQIYVRIINSIVNVEVNVLLNAVVNCYNGSMETIHEDGQYIFSVYLPQNQNIQAFEYKSST